MSDRQNGVITYQNTINSTNPQQTDNDTICKDFLWAKCKKFDRCRYRHELNVEAMKANLKFGHDFQNKTFCSRRVCSFLHATKEEQEEFLRTGRMPRVLAERHEALAAEAAVSVFKMPVPQAATTPQHTLMHPPRISVVPPPRLSLMPPPPPPPPLAPPPPPPPLEPEHTLQAAQPVPTTQPSATPTHQQPQIYPTPPQNLYPGYSNMQNNVAAGFSRQSSTQSLTHDVLIFDPSRPPPPTSTMGSLKRAADIEAGPSKMAKVDHGLCDDCCRRQKRIAEYKHDIDRMLSEEADKNFLLEKKLEEFERKKRLLLAFVPADQQRSLELCIEDTPIQETNTNAWSLPGNMNATSTIPTQILVQFLEWFSKNATNGASSIETVRRQEPSVMHTQTSMPRWTEEPRTQYNATWPAADSRTIPTAFHPAVPPPSAYYANANVNNAQPSTSGSRSQAQVAQIHAQYPSYYTPYYP